LRPALRLNPTPKGADAAAQGVLESIPAVDLAEGKWKYVQIELTAPGEPQKRVVRSARVGYHPEVYELTMNSLARSHGPVVRGTVIGGGRIVYDPSARTVDIYGYSKSFGRAKGCNERSAQIVRDNLPGVEVTWSDKGY